MATCKNCNKELDEGMLFCDACGAKLDDAIICKKCGEPIGDGVNFCQICGTPVAEKKKQFDIKSLTKYLPIVKDFFLKLDKKILAFGVGAVALVLVIAIVLSILLSGGGRPGFILYFKEGEMYYTASSKISSVQVTDSLINGNSLSDADLQLYERFYTVYPVLCVDGETLFYVDKIEYDSGYGAGNNLYYRNIKKPSREPVKIDSDITDYYVNDSGKIVTYLKGYDDDLYQHNLKDKEKVASDVSLFSVSSDGKNIAYLTNENVLYFYDGESIKTDEEIQAVEYISEDCKTVYYLKDNILYKNTLKGEKVEIASDVQSFVAAYHSGVIYYTKESEKKISALDFIEDDMKEADDALTQPTAPVYPSLIDYKSQSEYNKALEQYNTDYLAYTSLLDEFSKKLDRDVIRQALADSELADYGATLYYFDGKEEKIVSDNYCGVKLLSDKKPLLVISTVGDASMEKIKMSEINYAYEVEETIKSALDAATKATVVIKETASSIELENPSNFVINEKADTIYFFANILDMKGDLYNINVSGNKVGEPKVFDINVFTESLSLTSDEHVIYFKDVDVDEGEMYVDLILVDYDVNIYRYSYSSENKTVAYITDFVDSKSEGTLNIYKGGKPTVVSEEVYDFIFTEDGKLSYLYDYNTDRRRGELKLFDGKKSKTIDNDVTAFFYVSLYTDYYYKH